MQLVEDAQKHSPLSKVCDALVLSRRTYYAWRKARQRTVQASPATVSPLPSRTHPRALNQEQRTHALSVLNSSRFVDHSASQVYATLLDEGVYLGSERTLYRLLKQAGHNTARYQRRRPATTKPELLATGPNQLWSWDITKLKAAEKWTYFHLYVIIDVFSRYVVGWMVAEGESSELAQGLISDSCLKQEIRPGQLTLHADRGSSMTSKGVGELLMDLGVIKSHSRPHVSDDNPFSEAHFKTLKYRPSFPERFGSIQDARAFCQHFFQWYNTQHRHSGLAYYTPEDVHYGQTERKRQARQETLSRAFVSHPERFVRGVPMAAIPPCEVWINKPSKEQKPKENIHESSLK